MNDKGPQLGQLIIDGEKRRDAVHIAVAPVTAATRLSPGDRVGFMQDGNTELVGEAVEGRAIGIVDPFLKEGVEKGARFWLFLFPNTVTSLRHVWTSPAFTAANRKHMEAIQ